jgi:tRNA-5-taurinomethyluridine 2-sulfurtransferase
MHRVLLRGPLKGDKITIAMSGGVDSSVTAALLAYQDKYELEGIFMRNWDTADDDSMGGRGCRWEQDWEDVRSTCKVLGIKARMVSSTYNIYI